MNLLSSVLAFVLLPVAAAILIWGGIAIGRLTSRRVSPGVASLGLLVTIGFGLYAAFEFTGSAARAVIIAKTDDIEIASDGLAPDVHHNFMVAVSPYSDQHRSGTDFDRHYQLLLSATLFDRLRAGETVMLREYAIGPLRLARLEDASVFESVPWEQLDRLFSAIAWPVTILACVLLFVIARFGASGRLMIASIAVLATFMDLTLTRYWWDTRDSQGRAQVVALNKVVNADIIDFFSVGQSSYSAHATHVTLPRPYDQVRLAFSPSAGGEAISILDRVDAGTEGRLQPGDSVGVSFSIRHPRDARLATGSRSYIWRNLVIVYGAEMGLLIALGLAGALFQKYRPRFQEYVRARRDIWK